MATLTELRNVHPDSSMLNKVSAAISIAADTVIKGNDTAAPFSQAAGDHDLRVAWAKEVFPDPDLHAKRFWVAMTASSNAAAIGAITGADDATIKTKVDASVDLFAGVAV